MYLFVILQVISMYRQLLDLVQFDCRQHHLTPSVVQLSHKTLLTILSSVGLEMSDSRVKTLTGCFTLLKFTEKSMQVLDSYLISFYQIIISNIVLGSLGTLFRSIYSFTLCYFMWQLFNEVDILFVFL